MTSINLTQMEADALLEMEKSRVDSDMWSFPDFGGSVQIPLISVDRSEHFILDLWRTEISFQRGKGTFQNRGRRTIPLARLDFGGTPHRNPDGAEIKSPHLHLYQEGFEDGWAFVVPPDSFSNLEDVWQTLSDFMRYCNITEPPIIQKGLFT